MKGYTALLAALAVAPSALAHTAFTDMFVNGAGVGDGVAMRMNPDPGQVGNPVAITTSDMACNVNGDKGVARTAPVPDGATLTFEMRNNAGIPNGLTLDPTHKGPCALYLKKVNAPTDPGSGNGWFKVFASGYDGAKKEWCTDKVIANKGMFSVTLPKGLQSGYYLARPEILALHVAWKGEPQFYTGCGQIFIQGSGTMGPDATVAIPGYVAANQPATSFNIFNMDATKYPMPGPPVAKLVAKGAGQATQTLGLKPPGCILEVGNWCGMELPDYKDSNGCWDAGNKCYAMNKDCLAGAGPTGNKACGDIWNAKCAAIQAACKANNFNGPPNKGKDLTPPKNKISPVTFTKRAFALASRGSAALRRAAEETLDILSVAAIKQ